jgi:sulfite reductase beta subunit-like hemoprotein
MSAPTQQLSPIESLKEGSKGLRGNLKEELAGSEFAFSSDSAHLIKFHGMYQQKHRDKPIEGETPKSPVLMVRGKIPGGRLSAKQWLAWDDLADRFGDGTLRITTRQGIELHGVLKSDAQSTLQSLRDALQTTKGACGDVVRNVIQAPNPWGRADLAQLDAIADELTEAFHAKSDGYADIFLDGESVEEKPESIYGPTYLPRKFKIALTAVGNNSVDIYTHDLGFAATQNAKGLIDGFFVFAGGGMGMTHHQPETFPRLANNLGWIPSTSLIAVAKAVVGVHRDFGDRSNRRRARLKYIVHDRGLDWLKAEVEARAELHFEDRILPAWNTPSYLGWIERKDGSYALGMHTLSGRIANVPGKELKRSIRTLLQAFQLDLQLTPEQDLILLGIAPQDRKSIDTFFRDLGLSLASPSPLHDRALACVALPYCSVAITEAERIAPRLLKETEELLRKYRLLDRAPVLRITGCPNGCSRPYAAELALVGQAVNAYALFVGGDAEGTRLTTLIEEKIPLAEIPTKLDRLFRFWAEAAAPGERFGDFAARLPTKILTRVLNRSAEGVNLG